MAESKETFLPQLAKSFESIKDEEPVSTRGFAAACDRILPIFDHLGGFTVNSYPSCGKSLQNGPNVAEEMPCIYKTTHWLTVYTSDR